MELGKEEISLEENKEQEKISIVINGKKPNNTATNTTGVPEKHVIEQKSLKGRVKEEFTSRKFRGGAFSSIFIVFILIAVVLVNMIVGQFDLKVDFTNESTYTLTNQTKQMAEDIKNDVTLYYIVESGKEVSLFKNIIEKYSETSDKIKIVYKDPVLYPDFTAKYVPAGSEVSSNSVVVVNESTGKYKYIPYAQMYNLDYSQVYNGNAKEPTVTAIDVEGQITAAIKNVTSEKKSKIYTVSGHGEELISDYLKEEFIKLGTQVEPLNIRGMSNLDVDKIEESTSKTDTKDTSVSIPNDCSVLYICGPTTDYSEAEVEAIKSYMQKGGKVVIMLNYQAKSMNNFYNFLKFYGLQVIEGVVMENASHSGGGIPYVSYVDTTNINKITDGINDKANPVIMPTALGIKEIGGNKNVTIEKFLNTSSEAYCRTSNDFNNESKKDTDVAGPFDSGILLTEKYNEVKSQMIVYSSYYVADDKFVQQSNFGNVTLLNNTISFLLGEETGLSIPKRSMLETRVKTTNSDTVFYTVILIVTIPILLLATGFLIWYMRRRKA